MNLLIKKISAWTLCLIFLLGITFAGNRNVLCIGEDGRIEFETICLPCCGESDKVCDLVTTVDHHGEQGEHSECSNCYDLDLNGSQWIKRNRTTDDYNITKLISTPLIESKIYSISTFDDIKNPNQYNLFFGQSPPSASLSTIVLRC